MVEHMSAAQLHALQNVKKTRNKFKAQRTEFDGISFDSKKEAARWAALLQLQRIGEITDLTRQVPIMLESNGERLKTRTGRDMRLTVDFYYVEVATGLPIYEDAKGFPTRDYEVRRAVAATMRIDVLEV